MGGATGGGDLTLIGRLRTWADCLPNAEPVVRDLRLAADLLEECRSAMQRLERRWKDIDLNKAFTFGEDAEAMRGLFAALAKLEGRADGR